MPQAYMYVHADFRVLSDKAKAEVFLKGKVKKIR